MSAVWLSLEETGWRLIVHDFSTQTSRPIGGTWLSINSFMTMTDPERYLALVDEAGGTTTVVLNALAKRSNAPIPLEKESYFVKSDLGISLLFVVMLSACATRTPAPAPPTPRPSPAAPAPIPYPAVPITDARLSAAVSIPPQERRWRSPIFLKILVNKSSRYGTPTAA